MSKDNEYPGGIQIYNIKSPGFQFFESRETFLIRRTTGDYAGSNFSLGCLQRGQRQSSGRSSKATPPFSAGSYT